MLPCFIIHVFDFCVSSPTLFRLFPYTTLFRSQVPQGGTGLSVSATTTIFLKDISPAAIAENKATRSAQHVTGYAAFSMLHPTNTFPVDVNSAAPTANLEYGM